MTKSKKLLTLILSIFLFTICLVSPITVFGAKQTEKTVVLNFVGIEKEQEVLSLSVGETIGFSNYEVNGYSLKVYDDQMNEIQGEEYMVSEDTVLNFVYGGGSVVTPGTDKARVIILAGQSNGAGVGRYNCLKDTVTPEFLNKAETGFDNVLMTGYSHGHYYPEFRKVKLDHTERSTDVQGTFGPEIFMAERLSEVFPNETVYIVKTAYGATSLDYDFLSPSGPKSVYFDKATQHPDDQSKPGWLYDILINSMNSAIEQITKLGKTPSIEAFMWLQGESDAVVPDCVLPYLDKFNALISDIKNEYSEYISNSFSVYDAAIYTGDGFMFQYSKEINEVKKSRVDANNFYIDVNELGATTNFEPYASADCAHYDATSYINISRALVDTYVKKINPSYSPDTLTIEGPSEITISKKNGNVYLPAVTVKYNGNTVTPKFFFESSANTIVNVKNDGKLVPQTTGTSTVKIIAYYNNTFAFKLVKVRVTNT